MEPLSLETFTIHYMQKSINNHGIIKKLHQQQFISNEYYQILIDNYSGRIKQILDKKNNKILNIDQNFFQYIATSSQVKEFLNFLFGLYYISQDNLLVHIFLGLKQILLQE